ncbi:MAG TPA: SCP2 sterol-binding domain-containing protein [Bdellovibrionota bacterium]|nr:SCP2 sterol-binding domain-containing protein [Bdellovibrionota bacterium]
MTITIKEMLEGRLPTQVKKKSEAFKEENATIAFCAPGEGGGDWTLKLMNGSVEVTSGKPESQADCTLEASSETWLALFNGKMHYAKALLLQRLKVRGNKGLALKLATALFR